MHTYRQIPLLLALRDERKINALFYGFIILYVTAWTLLPTLFYSSLPIDVVEELMWGNSWQLGYFKHPFLTAWLVKAYSLMLPAGDWKLYLLSQLAVATCLIALWKLAKKMLSPLESFLSVLITSTICYYNANAIEFNPNVFMLPLWALALLSFYSALKKQSLWQWALTGLWAGLALLAKYESGVLIGVMGLFMFATTEGRKSFCRLGPYLGVGLCLLIFSPHVVWLAQHDWEPVHYFFGRIHTSAESHCPQFTVIKFTLAQLLAALPALITFIPLYRCKSLPPISNFDKKFIYFIGLSPLVLTSLSALTLSATLHSAWGTPLLSGLGLLLIGVKHPEISDGALKKTLALWGIAFSLTLLIIGLDATYGPKFYRSSVTSKQFPAKTLANTVTAMWHNRYHKKLLYVAGEYNFVNYIAAYSQDYPTGYSDWQLSESAWISEAELKKQGGIFVWDAKLDHKLPAPIQKRYPSVKVERILILHHTTPYGQVPLIIGVAFLPPEGVVE